LARNTINNPAIQRLPQRNQTHDAVRELLALQPFRRSTPTSHFLVATIDNDLPCSDETENGYEGSSVERVKFSVPYIRDSLGVLSRQQNQFQVGLSSRLISGRINDSGDANRLEQAWQN